MLADVSLSDTPRSTLTRLRERARSDRADLYAVLDAGLICHLGLVRDGAPVVLPTGYARSTTPSICTAQLEPVICESWTAPRSA
jgi:hypothetical protein